MAIIINIFFIFLFSSNHFNSSGIQGHWIYIPDHPKSCTEELIFSNKHFKIIHECFDENEIYEVATGSYLTDGPLIYFSNLRFTSRVSDFYTREYSRIEWKIASDTLTLNVIRYESERRTFLRY